MRAVHECINRRDASLLAGYLTDHGIPAEVRGGAWQAVEGELTNLRGALPRVYVLQDQQEEAARSLVDRYLHLMKEPPAGDPWICPTCGESLEPQFLSCWKCQTVKP
jgi:hypothetical protein